jgi:hypothetical protein
MKKIFLAILLFLFTASSYAQQPKPVKEIDPEIKEKQTERDTAKAVLRVKTLEHTKDMNRYDRLYNTNKTLKEKLKVATKEKKTEKAEALEEKVTAYSDTLKELDMKIKSDKKELATLETDLEKAEKALKATKERIAKEKAKK